MNFEQILKYFKIILDEIVIKYKEDADKEDTEDSILQYEQYKICKNGEDTIYSHNYIDPEILIECGIPEEDVELYSENPSSIPSKYIPMILEKNRAIIINQFESNGTFDGETNTYYRTLLGLPPVTETEDDFFYTDEETAERYFIDPDTPIHQLPISQIAILQNIGFIDELIIDNPNEKYLHHLGTKRLNLSITREASNFQLLFCPSDSIPVNLYEKFLTAYEASRSYILHVFYIKEYVIKYDMYNHFIAMMIAVNALWMVTIRLFDNVTDSNYYDIQTIITFFNEYGIPYVEELKLEYQTVMAANAYYLIRIKGRDLALETVIDLLGFQNAKVTKYFLVKDHRIDGNGNPVFIYKDKLDDYGHIVKDADGNPVQVLDYEKMFDIFFQEVDFKEENVQLALADSSRKIPYKTLIHDDPYWIDDEELRDLIYTSNYNYELTKYIGINTSYDMSDLLFNITYSIRSILDLKGYTSNMYYHFVNTGGGQTFHLFDTIVLLMALMCKANGVAGQIATSASKASVLVGFNFDDIPSLIELLKEENKTHPEILDDDTLEEFLARLIDPNPVTANDMNTIFDSIKSMNSYLYKKMNEAKTIQQLRFYKKVYDIIMYTKQSEDIFRLSTGEVAKTYSEYLKDANYELYEFYDNQNKEIIGTTIRTIIGNVSNYVTELSALSSLNNDENTKIDILKKFVNFFKSYTTDLANIVSMYTIREAILNHIYMIDEVKHKQVLLYKDSLNGAYSNGIRMTKVDNVSLHDTISIIRH